MESKFERIIQLIGQDGLSKLRNSHVMVIGLGGVGGYVAEALARSAIGELTLIDYDSVTDSNLNRQIIATKDTIGKNKAVCFKERIESFGLDTKVNSIAEFIDENNIANLFKKKVDYVVDAIDTMTTKVFLWKYCQGNNISLISSLGTAKKMDLSKLCLTTLKKTQNDPMARALRSIARKNDVSLDVPVVFTDEAVMNHEEKLGSMIFVPAAAGLLCAQKVVVDIIGQNTK